MVPPNAGAVTAKGSWMRPPVSSSPSQLATNIFAGSEPTAPLNGGVTTSGRSRMRPPVSSLLALWGVVLMFLSSYWLLVLLRSGRNVGSRFGGIDRKVVRWHNSEQM